METYVILRRDGWRTEDVVREAAARSTAEGERMPDDIAWIRSYVARGARRQRSARVCIDQASSPEAIRRHAAAADLPFDEIVEGRRNSYLVRARNPGPVTADRRERDLSKAE